MKIAGLLLFSLVVLTGCRKSLNSDFPLMREDFVNTTLSFSPVNATAQGYHKHLGTDLDSALDDVSRQAVDRQRNFYASFHERLNGVDPNALQPEDRADLEMIQGQIALALLDLDLIQSWRHNPTGYLELIGSALFSPFVLEYAPKADRARHIISRLEKIPIFCDQAAMNLFASPPVWIRVAREENRGNIDLIDKTLREWIPAGQKDAYDRAARSALVSLREFDHFLAETLPQRTRGKTVPDWRLGADFYGKKFRFALATDLTPDQVLNSAEMDVKRVHKEMYEIAKNLGAAGDSNHAIREALDKIAERHSTPESFFQDAKADLEEARNFVRQKNLLTLPAGSNLQVVETPPFMRGIYAVGGFNAAPALQPQLGAFYWITPIPSDWEKPRIQSKLREYNFFNLRLLTIHEAMPGHYVQGEFANRVQPSPRRVLRGLSGNGPYVEGWAQYATQMVLDEGFLEGSPQLRLTFLKQELRVLANAIIDIRLQTNRMTEQQALDLMEKDTFQERQEAEAKIQRAELSSAQLPTYLVGWRDWNRVREQYKQAKGASYNLHDFNDAALKEGAVPLPMLARLLTGKPLQH